MAGLYFGKTRKRHLISDSSHELHTSLKVDVIKSYRLRISLIDLLRLLLVGEFTSNLLSRVGSLCRRFAFITRASDDEADLSSIRFCSVRNTTYMKMTSKFISGLVGLSATVLMTSRIHADVVQSSKFYTRFDVGAAFQEDVDIKRFKVDDYSISFPLTYNTETPAKLQSDWGDLLDDLDLSLPSGTYRIQPFVRFDTGVRFDVTLGYQLFKNVALEFNTGLIYNHATQVGVDVSTPIIDGTATIELDGLEADMYQIPLLFNVIYQVPTHWALKPYVGVGAGGVYSILDINANLPDISWGETLNDFTFGYQGMVGVTCQISKHIDVGVGYKFLGTFDHEDKGSKTEGTRTHSASILFTWHF